MLWAAGLSAQSPVGSIGTIAGTGTNGYSTGGGSAATAQIELAYSVTADRLGNIYVADSWNHRIRKVAPDGSIKDFAGDGTQGSSGDGGPAVSARLSFPRGLAVDALGNVFVSDSGNRVIRKIETNGVIQTVAGNGQVGDQGDGGPATQASFRVPRGLAVDAAGNLYIADSFNARIRKVGLDGKISTFAGTGQFPASGDRGPATNANIGLVHSLAFDPSGRLYFTDIYNHLIRRVTAGGLVETVAGSGQAGFSGDDGPAPSAALNLPRGLVLDAAGDLFFSDSGNNRIRKVTPEGTISTVAGDGTGGFSGDGGPATSAQLNGAASVAVDVEGNLLIADSLNYRIRRLKLTEGNFTNSISFAISNRGGTTAISSGVYPNSTTGFAGIQPNAGSTTPAGLAILGFRQNNVLVTETGVPASPLIRSGRIYAAVGGSVNTGLALANPNSNTATVLFYFTDSNGNNFRQGGIMISPGRKTSAFLNELPFDGGASLNGTFTFNSSLPIAAIAIRGYTNERSEFLITTLPVTDLSAPPATGTVMFPDFANGGGWTTQIVLVNPVDTTLTGNVQFLNPQGGPATVTVNGQSGTSFAYSIPPRSSKNLQTAGTPSATLAGSVRAVPSGNTVAPAGLTIFSLRTAGITVTEAGVPASPVGTAFRLFVEASGSLSSVGSIQTGLAVANASTSSATVSLDVTTLDGTSTGLVGTLSIPANGQTATFLNQIPGLTALPASFQGVLRVSSTASISVVGLLGHYNERGDFLITTTPASNEALPASATPLYLPHIVDSGGYTTQFVVFSGQAGQSSAGVLQLFSATGGSLNLTLR